MKAIRLFAAAFLAATTASAQLSVDYAIAVHSEVAGGGTNGIPVTPNFTAVGTTKATYVQWREALISFANLCHARSLPWNCQCDWNFLEGIRRFELPGGASYDAGIIAGTYVDGATGLQSTNTQGRNVMKYLRENLGVNLDPHSHETGGYNYADIAWLLDVPLDTEPTAVVGGHVYSGSGYQDWPKFLRDDDGNGLFDGLRCQKYSVTGYRWRPQLLMGGGTASHSSDPHTTGLWRPTVPTGTNYSSYFTHGTTDIVAVGNWEQDFRENDRLLRMLECGELPHGNKLWVVGRVFNHRDFVQPGYLATTAPAMLDTIVAWRNAGRVTVRTWTEILARWLAAPFGGTSSLYFRPEDNVSFSLNVQDFSYPERSIADLRALLSHHEAARVPVDVFFTTWQTDLIESMAPDLLGRLQSSAWVSMGYHVRAPKPYANNYNWWTAQGRTITATDIANYEGSQLDMTTGESVPGTSGGFAKLSALMGYAPPVVGNSNGNSGLRSLIASHFGGAGAKLLVEHRDGVAVNLGERQNNVYLRPESYDWILIESYNAGEHLSPAAAMLDAKLALGRSAANAVSPYFVGVKLHDNDAFATQSAWTYIYQNGRVVPPWNTTPKAPLLETTDPVEPARRLNFYRDLVTVAASRRTALNTHNVRDTLSLLALEQPVPVGLSVTEVNETTTAGATVAELSGGGIASGVACTYSLVSGSGDTDNALLAISGANLVATARLDFETNPVLNLRVQWTDGSGTTGQRALTITLANITTDDDDGDGFTEAQETFAGTNPLNPASRLAFTTLTRAGNFATLSWASVAGKKYRVETSTDLVAWSEIAGSEITASGATTTRTVPSSGADVRRFFRVKVVE